MLTESEKVEFAQLRKQIIHGRYRGLNGPQREAVTTVKGPLLLLAGAGSGKTTVLIHRIVNLIYFGEGSESNYVEDHKTIQDLQVMRDFVNGRGDLEVPATMQCVLNPAPPWTVLAITFTNKAAGELKERLERELGSTARDVWASTFHSCCVRILRRDIEHLGFAKSFTIYDSNDSLSVVKTCMKELTMDDKEFPPRTFLSAISKAKDGKFLSGDYAREAEASGDYFLKKAARVYSKYEKKLWDAQALDFDDIILHTVRLFETCPDVLAYYQKKFRYVLIDEYQDTNQLQYRLASLLAGGYQNFCVVGDDDQSIYRFRGATIENILNFENQYRSAKVIRLEENYRSTQRILEASNAVIGNNRNRKGKTLWTQSGEGDLITVKQVRNETEEAHYIVDAMSKHFASGGKWKDCAVLYRMNAQSNQMENACRRLGVPYRIVGGLRFFDRAEVKDMLAYLTVLSNPEDDLRLMRIVNTPARGLGGKTLEAISDIALMEGVSMFTVMDNVSMYPSLQRSVGKIREFTNMIAELLTLLEVAPLPDFYETLMRKTGYVEMLESKKTEENAARLENVKELATSIQNYIDTREEGQEPTLDGFLDEIALFTDLDTKDQSSDFVTMMTMHSAKGLEFPIVFLPGLEEGIFPSGRVISDDMELEEERRLCYVGLTRAKQKLHLCFAKERMLYGRTSANRMSRFIEEIPDDLLDLNVLDMPEPEGTGGSSEMGGYSGGSGGYGSPKMGNSFHGSPKANIKKSPNTSGGAAAAQPKESFAVGDAVEHSVFGSGKIESLTVMGNDAMLAIALESGETKRVMLNTVRAYLTKK